MQITSSLLQLEELLKERQPILYSRLQPGITETKIRKILATEGIEHVPDALIKLYQWKNGEIHQLDQILENVTITYGDMFQFLNCSLATLDHKGLKEVEKYLPHYDMRCKRAFPFLCDENGAYIAFDLESTTGELWYIEYEDSELVRPIGKFDDFIQRVIEGWRDEIEFVISGKIW